MNGDQRMILILDIGTTGGRAILYDHKGNPYESAYREYRSIFHSQNVIDHDPNTWLQAVKESVAELKKKVPGLFEKIEAISITTQRATILPVNSLGEPIANAISWQDKRTSKECKRIEEEVGLDCIYERTGLKIDPYFSLPKLLWFKTNMPEVYNSAAYFLTVHDYLVCTLTGTFKTDWTQASRTMLFNIHEFEWDSYLATAFDIDLTKMPEAHPTGTIAGFVTQKAMEEIGLPIGIPVVMAGGDQQCAAVGLGAIRPGIVKVTTGTGSFVVAPIDKPIASSENKLICSASAIPGQWVIEAGIFTTGATYRWLRDTIFHDSGSNEGSYQILNAEADKSPAGSNGVLHIPHYAGSAAPYWDPKATGMLFNLNQNTKMNDIVRSYLEGICFEINKNISLIRDELKNVKKELKVVHVSGGLVRSNLFNQIQANVYGVKVYKGITEQATSLGATIIAAISIGIYESFNNALEHIAYLDNETVYVPDKELHGLYVKMNEIHDDIYSALKEKGIYDRMNSLFE